MRHQIVLAFGIVFVATIISVLIFVSRNNCQKIIEVLGTSISKLLEIGPKEYHVNSQEVWGMSRKEYNALSVQEKEYLEPRDYYHLNLHEISQAEQTIKDLIRSSEKVVLGLAPRGLERDITNSVSLDEMSECFYFVDIEDAVPELSPRVISLQGPAFFVVFYPSNIKFDFYSETKTDYYSSSFCNSIWSVRVTTEDVRGQDLLGKVSKEFIVLCLDLHLDTLTIHGFKLYYML